MSVIAKKAGASMETLYARPLDPEREPREELTRYGIELVSMIAAPDMQRLHRIVIAGSIESPELGSMLWEAGPGRGFNILRAYLHEWNRKGTSKVDDPDHAARLLMGMLVGEIAIRTTLGMATKIKTRNAQCAWATYVVDNFLKTLA